MAMYDPTQTGAKVLKDDAIEMKGQDARLTTILGAVAVSDLVKTTLGPHGMDKIIMSVGRMGSVTVTNDGATILRKLMVDNPAGKILVDISKAQDDEIGDGTTSVCVLAGQLLSQAEKLLSAHIHPQTIVAGWRMALNEAKAALADCAIENNNEERFRSLLFKVAKTTLSFKIVRNAHDQFAQLAVDAVMRIRQSGDLELIQILKKSGGSMSDSYLEEGFILDKKIGVGQPRRIEKASIMVANTPMDTDKIKIYGAKVKTDSISKVAEIEKAEIAKMMAKCEKITSHGINCFINRQLIYNKPEQYFASKGVMAIEHADFDGIERLARALGADIVSTFDTPGEVKIGSCDLIEECMIGEDRMIRFSGCHAPEACTIVMRGSSQHILDEAERSLHDALCVLLTAIKDPRFVYGGGCAEIAMAERVDALAKRTAGKKSLAIEAFAQALRTIPKIIAENGGFDSEDLVTRLRVCHVEGKSSAGLDMRAGDVGDMEEMGITESYRSKLQSLVSAEEAAEMIVRCDEVIRAAPRARE